jgi:SNF2 family DNA or RNA helicase
VAVGDKAPSTLGLKALLDFDVGLSLDGVKLTPQEIEELLRADHGLVLIKGKWVEVDRAKLTEVLEQWRAVERKARDGGVSFAQAMRLLAGAEIKSGDDGALDERPAWSEVIAGRWLAERLTALRSPARQADIEANAGLTAELRPYQKNGVAWLQTLRGSNWAGVWPTTWGSARPSRCSGCST